MAATALMNDCFNEAEAFVASVVRQSPLKCYDSSKSFNEAEAFVASVAPRCRRCRGRRRRRSRFNEAEAFVASVGHQDFRAGQAQRMLQ